MLVSTPLSVYHPYILFSLPGWWHPDGGCGWGWPSRSWELQPERRRSHTETHPDLQHKNKCALFRNCKVLWGTASDLCTEWLTCQVEVLQGSLRSHCDIEFGAESAESVIGSVDFTSGRSDVVCVCDGGSGVNVLNLHTRTHRNVNIKMLNKPGKLIFF